MKKKIRIILSILIILLTILAFTYYLSHHAYLIKDLSHISPSIIIWVLLLYIAMFGVLALILQATLRICNVSLRLDENLLLNAYASFINFFVPGQGGPAIRGAYLKKQYGLLIRRYLFITLLYYACYALVSALMLMIGSKLPWIFTLVAVVLLGVLSVLAMRIYANRTKLNKSGLDLSIDNVAYLLFATVLQAIVQTIIYFIELHSVNSHVALKQTIAYTGVADFALFVALTPGAIGIRESFLIFSERLHHISSANIISANIIDRSVFILFLGILFLFVIAFHAKNKFAIKKDQAPAGLER
jgi:uncharacterized membrane protein YbhN (UPF0104 family)